MLHSVTDCDHKSQDAATAGQANPDWDIALASMASTGANGSLGSVTGTIYAAHDRALFTDKVSGIGKLAVMTGCISVDGSTSTFDSDAANLYGNGHESVAPDG